MTKEEFNSEIEKIKLQIDKINETSDSLIKALDATFLTDSYGVANSWLFDIIENEFVLLCKLVNPKIEIKDTESLFNYWAWDQNFKGEVIIDDKSYNLATNLYEYIKEGL